MTTGLSANSTLRVTEAGSPRTARSVPRYPQVPQDRSPICPTGPFFDSLDHIRDVRCCREFALTQRKHGVTNNTRICWLQFLDGRENAHMRGLFRLALIAVVAMVLAPSVAHAQAGIAGVVKDTSGAVLPG